MKKNIFILLIVFLIISAAKKEEKVINRTIMIMPVYNLKKSVEFEYLTDVIRDAIRAKLDQKNLFNFIDYNEIDEGIKKMKLKDADLINEKKVTDIALSFGADVIILSKYAIEGENIMIISQAYDMLYQQISVVSSVTGSTGVEIFNNIEKLTDDMSQKMAGKFTKIERVVLEQLILKQYGQQMLKTFQDAKNQEKEKKDDKTIITETPKNDLVLDNKLILIKGGSFIMGNKDGGVDEKIEHEVALNDFYISKYEVTQQEYKDVMGKNPSLFAKNPNFPVHNVLWKNVISFCNKKSELEGLTPAYTTKGLKIICDWTCSGYRLPTEAEWEFAARGGLKSKGFIFSGGNELGKVGNTLTLNKGLPIEVGTLEPNELGLYDMTGNVSEWCWDYYQMNYYKQSIKVDPKGPDDGDERVVRGGNRTTTEKLARVTFRDYYDKDKEDATIGFRIVRSANPVK